MIKLVTGMNHDICPLHFREETERDRITPDPYFNCAPHWSSLSGGRKPYVHLEPVEMVRLLKRAAECVPLVRGVPVFIVDAQGEEREVSIEELEQMNIKVQPVPNLSKRAAMSGAGPSAPAAAPAPPAVNLAPLFDRQQALEDQLASIHSMLNTIVKTAAQPPAAAASAPAASASTAPAAAAEAAPAKRARRT